MSDDLITNPRRYDASLSAPKYEHKEEPMPSRDELLARNSFGSPDDNKYLNMKWQKPEKDGSAERKKAVRKKWGIK